MLTERKKRFAECYIISLNATQSAREAGYSAKSEKALTVKASDLKNDPEIKQYIEERLKKKEANLIVKQDEILAYLSGCIRGTEKETHVFVLRSGSKGDYDDTLEKVDIPLKSKDRIKACEIMAKIYKLMSSDIQSEPKIYFSVDIPKKVDKNE